MKKVLVVLGVICGLVITGSVSAYFLYVLPKYQDNQLAFEKEKWVKEQQNETNQTLMASQEKIRQDKAFSEFAIDFMKNNPLPKVNPLPTPIINTPLVYTGNDCSKYPKRGYERIDEAKNQANLTIDYWGTQFSKKYNTCVSIYFTADPKEIEPGNFVAVDESKDQIIKDSIFHVDTFYGNNSYEEKWKLTGKNYTLPSN